MQGVTWAVFFKYVIISAIGLYVGLTTRLRGDDGASDPAKVRYNLRLFAKFGGWVLGIGCLATALEVLGMLLTSNR